MGRSFRRVLVLFLALTFAASGMLARQCEAAHHTVAPPVQTDHAAHAGHAVPHVQDAQMQHDHHHGHGADASGGDVLTVAGTDHPAPAGSHDCGKCAGMCTVVYGATAGPPAAEVLASHPALFFCRSDPVSGGSVQVDPGIPKRMV